MRLFEEIGTNVQEKKKERWLNKIKKALLELSLRELKIWKKKKKSKNLNVAGNYPNISFTLGFQKIYMKNQNNQL